LESDVESRRLTNQDVIDLYNRVQIGATVIVQ
jgi:lipoprotein-anchoring transpeptidase ErfK/SrfK